jgi:hypothetical protein
MSLLRLVGATAPTGKLTLRTPDGNLELDVYEGRIPVMSGEELREAGKVLGTASGTFRFEPSSEDRLFDEDSVSLFTFVEAADIARLRSSQEATSDVDEDELIDLTTVESSSQESTNIHVLPSAPLENPLSDLLSDLEETAPTELLMSQLGTVTSDPRFWRGRLESDWKRRGWQLKLFADPSEVKLESLDCVVIHHQLSVTRVGHEEDWLELIRSAAKVTPQLPVIYIGPLGDPAWVHELVRAGCSFVLPAPQGDTGETLNRFIEDLTEVVDRHLGYRQLLATADQSEGMGELVEALLFGADSEQVISSLLLVAAEPFRRGALLSVEDTSIRCRAGFGYPLEEGTHALPRGVGLIERVVRSHEAWRGLEPDAASSIRLAGLLGLERLPKETAVVPLTAGATVVAVVIGDREGEPLPDLHDFVMLVRRLGGAVVSR